MLPERSFGELLDRARACHTHQDLSQFPGDACGTGLTADSSAGALALGSWTTGLLEISAKFGNGALALQIPGLGLTAWIWLQILPWFSVNMGLDLSPLLFRVRAYPLNRKLLWGWNFQPSFP